MSIISNRNYQQLSQLSPIDILTSNLMQTNEVGTKNIVNFLIETIKQDAISGVNKESEGSSIRLDDAFEWIKETLKVVQKNPKSYEKKLAQLNVLIALWDLSGKQSMSVFQSVSNSVQNGVKPTSNYWHYEISESFAKNLKQFKDPVGIVELINHWRLNQTGPRELYKNQWKKIKESISFSTDQEKSVMNVIKDVQLLKGQRDLMNVLAINQIANGFDLYVDELGMLSLTFKGPVGVASSQQWRTLIQVWDAFEQLVIKNKVKKIALTPEQEEKVYQAFATKEQMSQSSQLIERVLSLIEKDPEDLMPVAKYFLEEPQWRAILESVIEHPLSAKLKSQIKQLGQSQMQGVGQLNVLEKVFDLNQSVENYEKQSLWELNTASVESLEDLTKLKNFAHERAYQLMRKQPNVNPSKANFAHLGVIRTIEGSQLYVKTPLALVMQPISDSLKKQWQQAFEKYNETVKEKTIKKLNQLRQVYGQSNPKLLTNTFLDYYHESMSHWIGWRLFFLHDPAFKGPLDALSLRMNQGWIELIKQEQIEGLSKNPLAIEWQKLRPFWAPVGPIEDKNLVWQTVMNAKDKSLQGIIEKIDEQNKTIFKGDQLGPSEPNLIKAKQTQLLKQALALAPFFQWVKTQQNTQLKFYALKMMELSALKTHAENPYESQEQSTYYASPLGDQMVDYLKKQEPLAPWVDVFIDENQNPMSSKYEEFIIIHQKALNTLTEEKLCSLGLRQWCLALDQESVMKFIPETTELIGQVAKVINEKIKQEQIRIDQQMRSINEKGKDEQLAQKQHLGLLTAEVDEYCKYVNRFENDLMHNSGIKRLISRSKEELGGSAVQVYEQMNESVLGFVEIILKKMQMINQLNQRAQSTQIGDSGEVSEVALGGVLMVQLKNFQNTCQKTIEAYCQYYLQKEEFRKVCLFENLGKYPLVMQTIMDTFEGMNKKGVEGSVLRDLLIDYPEFSNWVEYQKLNRQISVNSPVSVKNKSMPKL